MRAKPRTGGISSVGLFPDCEREILPIVGASAQSRFPGSTWKREASPMPSNSAASVAGHPHLAAAFEASEQRRAALRIEVGGDLVEQQDRRLAAALGDQLGMGEDEAEQQRLLLAGRGLRAPASALARWVTARSWRCGPVGRAAGGGVAARGWREAPRRDRRRPSPRARWRRGRIRRRARSPSRSLERGDGPRARLGDRRAMLGHLRFERGQPGRRRRPRPRRAACCARASPLRSARHDGRGPAPARAPAGRGSAGGRPRCR